MFLRRFFFRFFALLLTCTRDNGLVSGAAGFRYECINKSGALMALQDDAEKYYILDNQDWVEYMRKNHASWHRFAEEAQKLRIEKEKIILIRGRIRAKRWFLSSFVSQGEALYLNFSGGVPYYGGGTATVSHFNQVTHSPESRQSPTFQTGTIFDLSITEEDLDTPPARDCIFLSSYRAKYRPRGNQPKKIKASGDFEDPPEGGSSGDEDSIDTQSGTKDADPEASIVS